MCRARLAFDIIRRDRIRRRMNRNAETHALHNTPVTSDWSLERRDGDMFCLADARNLRQRVERARLPRSYRRARQSYGDRARERRRANARLIQKGLQRKRVRVDQLPLKQRVDLRVGLVRNTELEKVRRNDRYSSVQAPTRPSISYVPG